MKINLKLSSKMHLMIIVSVAVIIAGLIVGLACKFTVGGYYNYAAEWSSSDSIVVSYSLTDDNELDKTCEAEFKAQGISYYFKSDAETAEGGQLVYRFYSSTSDDKLAAAENAINAKLEQGLSTAEFHKSEGIVGANKVLTYGSIAIATCVVFQFIYFAIRYKFASALSALLANVHNVLVYLALLALLRIPVGTSMIAFVGITVLLTIVGTCFMFDKARKNLKSESYAKLDANEQADDMANANFKMLWTSAAALAVVAVIMCVFLSISAGGAAFMVTPVLAALVCIASVFYGLAFFTPSVYSRIKKLSDKLIKSRAAEAKKEAKKSA